MAITKYTRRFPNVTPWIDAEDITGRLSRMLGDSPFEWSHVQTRNWIPAVNVEESAEEMILTAELPGMSDGDIELELEANVLTLRGQKQDEKKEDEEGRYHLCERRYGSFERSFALPRTVKGEEITALFKDGILHVHLPKVPEAKSRKIDIRAEK